MASWFLVPCLVQLRTEFNALNPKRDKGADGSVGDAAHLSETSDHNPEANGRVKALDIDSTGPWPGFAFATAVQLVIDRCRSGREDRIEYVIWDHHIYSRSYGFSKRVYTGTSDPHTNHAHFSARHDHHGESDTRGWDLLSLEDSMAGLTADDVQAAAKAGFIEALSDANAAAMGKASADNPTDRSKRNVRDYLRNVVGAPADPLIAAAKGEILAAVTSAGTTLTDAQVKAIGDAVGNAANAVLVDVVNKLERAGAALTQ